MTNKILHHLTIPGESAEYRTARNLLLDEEIALRRQIERVAAQRRALPLGGVLAKDYAFDGNGGTVKLSDLFAPGKTHWPSTVLCTDRSASCPASAVRTFSMVSMVQRSISVNA